MLALITGAGSGIGEAFAHRLASMNYDLILVGRNQKRLEAVREKILAASTGSGSDFQSRTRHQITDVTILTADLADREQCFALHRKVTEELHLQVDFLVNNAGVGVYGKFLKTDLNRELALIDVNVTAVHILTKLFLRDMEARGNGTILNVGSSAGFMAGPTFSSYYASKNYVVRLTEAIHEELRRAHSPVSISVLCPGPVRTDFNAKSDVRIPGEGLDPAYVAKLGVEGALKGKMVIVPGFFMKLGLFFTKHMSEGLMTRVTYRVQIRKE